MIEQIFPMANLATASDRFVIDPAEHIAVVKSLRNTPLQIVGCYHSHPNGQPQPSALDLAHAGPENFLWLIIGLASSSARMNIGAYIHQSSQFHLLQLA